jgi:hypothetical protein
MKKGILLLAIVMSLTTVAAYAQDGELHGTIDLTYASRFIWRGYDATAGGHSGNHSAFQPSIDLDLFGTGFGLNVWSSRINKSGFENDEWLTFTPYYKGMAFADEAYATAYKVGYTYFSYPDESRQGSNPGNGAAQEIFAGFAWPRLFGDSGLVPSYAAFAYWPSEDQAANRDNAGWAHVFALDYDVMVPSLLGDGGEQAIHLKAWTVYNDGVGPAGKAADHDFSHGTLGATTDFPLSDSVTFIPGIYYQSSWDDSINTSDEYWWTFSVKYDF